MREKEKERKHMSEKEAGVWFYAGSASPNI
jgi:hypothetical protein